MRIFAQKPKPTQQTASAESAKREQAFLGQSRKVSSIVQLQRAIGNQALLRLLQTNAEGSKVGLTSEESPHIGHDFSRIPVYSDGGQHAAFNAHTVSPGRGETLDDTEMTIGRKEVPVNFVGPLQPGDTRAVPDDFIGPLEPGVVRSKSFHPTISVVTPGRRTSDCGANEYKVKWGIPAVESASSGWIVQKVNETFQATDCAGNPIAPHPVDDPAGYPFWEAWEFTPGQKVWVGPAAGGASHSGDSFASDDYGPGTKGKATITGEVKAIVGFAPPVGMTVRNASPAWALPYTKTEPAQFASTLAGASHILTAEWNCCPNGTVTKATTVTTTP